jgi:hypothetical protein
MKHLTYKKATLFLGASTLILLFLLNKSCNPEPSFTTVKIPEIKNVFKTDTIEKQVTIYVPRPFKDRSNEEKLLNDISELNEQLNLYKEELDNAIDEFTYLDSINKVKAYADAIALREFNQPFEDEFIKIENSGYTFGTLKSLQTSYTIKEREIKVDIPKSKINVSAGLFLGNNTELSQFIYGGNLTVKNTSINYIRIGSQNYATVGRNFKLF